MESIDKSLKVYNEVNSLKDDSRLRKGWIDREIPGRLESVSEHCFAMSNLAILINYQYDMDLNMGKILTMINIHEYGEVKVGDITPKDKVPELEKYIMEEAAIIELMEQHPGKNKILNLWYEFEKKESREAIFVYLLDKFQSVLQAKEYSERFNRPEVFECFKDYYNGIINKVDTSNLSIESQILKLTKHN